MRARECSGSLTATAMMFGHADPMAALQRRNL